MQVGQRQLGVAQCGISEIAMVEANWNIRLLPLIMPPALNGDRENEACSIS